jgi:hypothetical protein
LIEQARMAAPEEEFREGLGKKRVGWGFFILGIIVSLIGFVIYDFHINYYRLTQTGREVLIRSEYPYQSIGLVVIIIGIAIISIWIIMKIYSRIRNA